MTAPTLVATARAMVGTGKGLLAMDESNPTCNKLRCARHYAD
jgi:fructose-bisphosphate aldolase class I